MNAHLVVVHHVILASSREEHERDITDAMSLIITIN